MFGQAGTGRVEHSDSTRESGRTGLRGVVSRPTVEPDPGHAGGGRKLVLGRCHLITDTRHGRDPLALLPLALPAGIDAVQVRVKDASDAEALLLVERALVLCREHGATCIVDDRLDVALAAHADGVHLGEEDLPVDCARAIAGPELLIGATVRTPEAARRAEALGATYLGVGPAFATSTKLGLPEPIGVSGVRAVCDAVSLPVIAIGGVTAANLGALLGTGAYGVAVIGAITDALDPGLACAELVKAISLATDREAGGS
jgi:thiamine-phosphate pyrophosphorylase